MLTRVVAYCIAVGRASWERQLLADHCRHRGLLGWRGSAGHTSWSTIARVAILTAAVLTRVVASRIAARRACWCRHLVIHHNEFCKSVVWLRCARNSNGPAVASGAIFTATM